MPLKAQHLFPLALTCLVTLAHADMGMLRITTDPGDAQVFINGQRKGNSPSQDGQSFAVKLPQGEYTVEARKSDGKDYYGKKSVFVANDSLQSVHLSLEKVTLPPKPYGTAPNGSVAIGRLEWLRCSVGQQWTGSNCAGSPKEFTWNEANDVPEAFNANGYGGKRDWRLPTIRELQSLVVCSTGFRSDTESVDDGGEPLKKWCNDGSRKPTLDTARFPNTLAQVYWSGSPVTGSSDRAWDISFGLGFVNSYYRRSESAVRLVRARE